MAANRARTQKHTLDQWNKNVYSDKILDENFGINFLEGEIWYFSISYHE